MVVVVTKQKQVVSNIQYLSVKIPSKLVWISHQKQRHRQTKTAVKNYRQTLQLYLFV